MQPQAPPVQQACGMELNSLVSPTGSTQMTKGTSSTSSPDLRSKPASSPSGFRPGVTAEGYVLQPCHRYLSADIILADLFDFREGDILSVPVQTSDLHPNTISAFRKHLVDSPRGPVYIMRRIMVVVKLYNNSMLCLPMFSFGLAGIAAVPYECRRDFVGVKQEGEANTPEGFEGIRRTRCECFGSKTMHPASLIHLLDAVHIRYNNDIVDLGRIPKESFDELMVQFYARQFSEYR